MLGEAVPRGMTPGDGVPGPVLDRHARLFADRLEENLDFRRLLCCEACLPPGEYETPAGLPDGDAPDLERRTVAESRHESTADARLECQLAIAVRRDLKQRVGSPPGGDFAAECLDR